MNNNELIKKVLDTIKDNGIDIIDLRFTDVPGKWHHLSLPSSRINEEFFKYGEGFDGSSVPGFKTIEAGDMLIVPDVSTFKIEYVNEQPIGVFVCDILDARTSESFSRDPRGIAKRAERYLKESGIGDYSLWGPEFEFHLLLSVVWKNDTNISMYAIDALEGFWNSDEDTINDGYVIPKKGGYHSIPPYDKSFAFRNRVTTMLESLGIKVRYHHHEVGSGGQNEIEIMRYPLDIIGDITMYVKHIIRTVAAEEDLVATFIPKPFYGEAGNGMHYHQHLFKDGKPLFYDEKGYAGLSKLAINYIGGILKHGRSLVAFTNPSTNSYKRLVPGYEAPVNLFFSMGNRSAAIRIPEYATEPMEKRIEFRPPDATANPYLAPAAMLMAGIDGIINEIDPTKEGMGPIDEDIFSLSEEERNRIMPIPSSLKEAMEALKEDHEYLLRGNVFSKDLIEWWIEKGLNDYKEVSLRPHPFEIEKYFGV